MAIYGRENLAANATVAVNLSGTAPPPSANGVPDQGQPAPDGQQGAAATSNIQQVPGRLDVLKWPLVAGFLGIFAVGAILLARKPVAVTVAPPENSAEVEAVTKSSPPPRAKKTPAPVAPVHAVTVNAVSTSMENVNAAVATSLEYLKDQLFRLELRHQAGTIPDEEYASERARAEKVLRDLVRG